MSGSSSSGDGLSGHRLKIASNVIVWMFFTWAFTWASGVVTNPDASFFAFTGWLYSGVHALIAIANVGRDRP